MSYAASYLKKQEDSLSKWHRFLSVDLKENFKPLPYSDQIAGPFQTWSREEQNSFFFLFNQFNAEALIIFEQCLMYAGRRFKAEDMSAEALEGLRYFVKEEFYHTKAFRQYLHSEKSLNFPQNALVVHGTYWLKTTFAWILRQEPLSIILPGAKSETYSLFYCKLLEKIYSKNANSFVQLNSMHSEDEVSHVTFDYHFVDDLLERRSFLGKMKFIFFTFLMIFFIQFIVLTGTYRMLRLIRPQDHFLKRIRQMFQLFKWVLWNFPPYIQTRNNLKATYRQRKSFIYRLLEIGSL